MAYFFSATPLENIEAKSQSLTSVLTTGSNKILFNIPLRTFKFDKSLMEEHFNEKFLESEKFPEATFLGKIIEDINFEKDGTFEIRAKGKLWIHGVEKERIIRSTVTISNGAINIQSHFTVALSDHNIKVPKVVHEKVSSEISVEISTQLKKKISN